MSSHDPLLQVLESLTSDVASAIEPALRRAFAEGYRTGMQEAKDNISDFLSAKATEQLPAILGANSVPMQLDSSGVRRSSPLRGTATNTRRYAYGSVIGAVRKAIIAHADTGITRAGNSRYCSQKFDVDVSVSSIRETLKRLSGDGEAVYRDNLWWPGAEMKPPSDDAVTDMEELM